jgi:hypothetical protein
MMRHRRGTMARTAGAAAAACAATLLAFGGGSAAAAPGDTFYLSEKKKTFVSFVIRAGSDEVSKLGYRAEKLPCTKGNDLKGMVVLDRTVPIQENLAGEPFFEAFWAPGHPSYGGLAGKIGATRVKGDLDLRFKRRKVSCETGLRSWTAQSVSEETWLAAREKQGFPEDGVS